MRRRWPSSYASEGPLFERHSGSLRAEACSRSDLDLAAGPVVRRPRTTDFSSSLELVLQFERATLADVLRAREILEPMMVRLAADAITVAQLVELQDTVDAMRANRESQRIFLEQSSQFFKIIGEACGSLVLRLFVDAISAIAADAIPRVEYTSARRDAVAEAHLRVLSALRAHDPDRAEREMMVHVEEGIAFWKRTYPRPARAISPVDGVVRWRTALHTGRR